MTSIELLAVGFFPANHFVAEFRSAIIPAFSPPLPPSGEYTLVTSRMMLLVVPCTPTGVSRALAAKGCG
ncbi:hypothetical protein GCM10010407_00010 [Rarobacter incanus]